MKLRALPIAVLATASLAAVAIYAQSGADRPLLGDANYEENPRVVWQSLQANEETKKILDILGSHKRWERNNVLKDAKMVADRAVIEIDQDGAAFKIKTLEKGTIDSGLIHGDTFYVWSYSEVNEEWVHQHGNEIRNAAILVRPSSIGPGTMATGAADPVPAFWKESDTQIRFPIKIVPTQDEEFGEARLVLGGKAPLLYLLNPGTNDVEEEWILKN